MPSPRSARALVSVVALASVPLVAFASCGGSSAPADASDASMGDVVDIDRVALADTFHPDAACSVSIDTPPLLATQHVPVGTDIQWSSNPPSSGPHFPVWAAFQAFPSPVPRGYYVHDEEHGAIVLLYNCAAGPIDCATIQAKLQQVSDALPDDPLCTYTNQGVRIRTVITPDPLLDVPVAAAAWGWTYRAECFDLQSLVDFARAHYGQGRESSCYQGQTTF